jgi:O-antigen ligase
MEKSTKLDFAEKLMVILFLLIMFTGRNIIANLKWGLIALFFILPALDICLRRKKIGITKITKRWLIVGLYVLLGIAYSYVLTTSIVYIVIFTIGVLFLTYQININVFLTFIRLAKVFCLIYAISNIFSALIPQFIPKFFSFFVTNLEPVYIELAGKNYSGLAGEKAVSAFIINIGIGILYAQMLVNGKVTKKDMVYLLILFCGLFLTGKRTLTLIPLLLLFVMYLSSSEKNRIIKLTKILSLVLVGIIILLMIFPSITHVIERFFQADDNGRNELWQSCIEMFKDSPIFGQGLGTFNDYNYDLGYRDYGGKMWTYEAHNIYYQILGELGIIGFLLIIFCFIYSIIYSIKLLRLEYLANNKQYKFIIYVSLYIQLLFLVYGLTGNTFYYWHQLFIYMISLSMLNMVNYDTRKGKLKQIVD